MTKFDFTTNWFERNLPQGKDLNRCPKPAIDAFINIHYNKI